MTLRDAGIVFRDEGYGFLYLGEEPSAVVADLPEAQPRRWRETRRAARSRERMTASTSPGPALPVPTSTSMPTTERTICQQNEVDADLVREEAVVGRRPRRREHPPDRGAPFGALAAERREVVLADERVGGEAQHRQVERLGVPTTRSAPGTDRDRAG